LFISHDMAVVERVAHRVAVMYRGQIVEIGPRQAVLNDPQHPYTRRLLAAVPVPVPDPRKRGHSFALDDSKLPSPLRRPNDPPVVAPLVRVGDGHFVARHRIGGCISKFTGEFANYVAWARYFPHRCRQLQEQGGTVRCRL
jgi:glutathione transport system ATP-binding protein